MILSIIVLSYNTKNLTLSCLSVITERFREQLESGDFEIIVVDNASTDGSVDAIGNFQFLPAGRQGPISPAGRDLALPDNFQLITNKENVGFAKGNNIGAKNAKGEYLLFLNSDTQVLDDGIKEMASFLGKNKEAGIIGGLLVDSEGKPARSYGKFYNLFNVFLMLFFGERGELLRFPHKEIAPVDWVSGGFMMVRPSLFKKLDGFDEDFFMYIEDVELCLRAKKMGFSVYFFPEAKAVHKGQGSSNRAFAIMHIYKGLILLYKKHASNLEYTFVKSMLIFKAISAIVIGVLTNNTYLRKTYLSALRYSL